MTTTVSSGEKLTSLNSADASAVMKDALETLFRTAFSFADAIEPLAISMPREDENSEESVTVNRPEPQYASIRYLIDLVLASGPEGRMWLRMYAVNLGRIELLF